MRNFFSTATVKDRTWERSTAVITTWSRKNQFLLAFLTVSSKFTKPFDLGHHYITVYDFLYLCLVQDLMRSNVIKFFALMDSVSICLYALLYLGAHAYVHQPLVFLTFWRCAFLSSSVYLSISLLLCAFIRSCLGLSTFSSLNSVWHDECYLVTVGITSTNANSSVPYSSRLITL